MFKRTKAKKQDYDTAAMAPTEKGEVSEAVGDQEQELGQLPKPMMRIARKWKRNEVSGPSEE